MIVLDSARADIFHENAPNFLSLASEGMLFTKAIAPAGWTLPSHASIFTGLSPTEHGIVALGTSGGTIDNFKNSFWRARSLEAEGRMVVPRLEAAGLRTFSSSSSPWLWKGSGLAAGFAETDFFYFLRGRPSAAFRRDRLKRLFQIAEVITAVGQYARWIRSGADKGAAHILESILNFATRGAPPFFAFTNLIETHLPHFPPHDTQSNRYRRLLHTRDVLLEPPLLRALKIRAHNYETKRMSRRVLQRWKEAYAAEIRYVDGWLLRLTEALDRKGLLSNTVIMVTSDHGEDFGEHGIVGHGLSVAETAAHVPLGMWGGDISRSHVRHVVSLLAIPPTLEDLLLGGSHPGSLFDPATHGRARIETEDPRHVSRPPRRSKREPSGPGAAFYDGNLKLVVDPFRGRALYDLEADPEAKVDILQKTAPTDQQQLELQAWEQRIRAQQPA